MINYEYIFFLKKKGNKDTLFKKGHKMGSERLSNNNIAKYNV